LTEACHIAVLNLIRLIDLSMGLVDELSVYLLSKENLKRDQSELDAVLEAETFFLEYLLPDFCNRHSIRVVHAGIKQYLPDSMNHQLEKLCNQTKGYLKKRINLLLGYHPLDEINDACARTSDEVCIEDLWVSSEVDLVIRTGGGSAMLSNFLPLQCGYANFAIVEDFFNDFTEEQFVRVYNDALALGMKIGL